MPYVTASDGCRLYYEVKGKADGQALFVTYPWTDALAEAFGELGVGDVEALKNGARTFIDALGEHYKIVHFDYPRGNRKEKVKTYGRYRRYDYWPSPMLPASIDLSRLLSV